MSANCATDRSCRDANTSLSKARYVEEIGHTAWGTVDYASPLSQQEIRDYELAPANMVQKPVVAVIERSEQNGLHELARDAG